MAYTGEPLDHSGTIAAGGVSQLAAPYKLGRVYLVIENIDDTEDLWVNYTSAAAVNGPGSFRLRPGGSITYEQDGFIPSSAVNVTATTIGHGFTCKDY